MGTVTITPWYGRKSLRGFIWAICVDGVPVSLHLTYPGWMLG